MRFWTNPRDKRQFHNHHIADLLAAIISSVWQWSKSWMDLSLAPSWSCKMSERRKRRKTSNILRNPSTLLPCSAPCWPFQLRQQDPTARCRRADWRPFARDSSHLSRHWKPRLKNGWGWGDMRGWKWLKLARMHWTWVFKSVMNKGQEAWLSWISLGPPLIKMSYLIPPHWRPQAHWAEWQSSWCPERGRSTQRPTRSPGRTSAMPPAGMPCGHNMPQPKRS